MTFELFEKYLAHFFEKQKKSWRSRASQKKQWILLDFFQLPRVREAWFHDVLSRDILKKFAQTGISFPFLQRGLESNSFKNIYFSYFFLQNLCRFGGVSKKAD